MNEQDLLSEGFTLLLLGMGTVFVFLTILVFVTSIMSHVIQAWFPSPVAAGSPPEDSNALSSGEAGEKDKQLVAVITAAVHQYRNSRHR